jgi:DNA helicase II / ATP-dependent DNA helicase PcrA
MPPFYADLHIHSKYSRACSRDCDLEHLAWWARRKGIRVVGSGDFTHPAWFEHLRDNLVPAEPGLFRLRAELDDAVERDLPPSCRGPVRFMLTVEISTIYKRAERTRKVHHLLYVADLDAAERINRRLARIGNIASDGRPILGLDSRDLLEITLESGPDSYLIPAHLWTPWFAVLGSKSGFDAVEDCYVDLADRIFALETGLSSDPAMNWRVSSLDRYRLVSNSDAHSPPMLGREATVFDCPVDYHSIRRALETGEGFGGTVEFFPEEGKYHLDGHRKCEVCFEPSETRRHQGRCPVCGKPLTVGVLHRVEELADRPEGARVEGAAAFRNLVQLPQVLGEILRVGPKSKAVAAQLDGLTTRLGPELGILTTTPLDEVERFGSPLLAQALRRLRAGQVIRTAGYDGEYGVIHLFDRTELNPPTNHAVLFDPPPEHPTPRAPHARAAPLADPAPLADAAEAAEAAGSPRTGQGASLPRPAALDPQGGHAEGGASRGELRSPLEDLDAEQREAAATLDGPLLIVAGPGTGKTRTLTHRIAHLVADRGVDPARCLAITFTRRAAEELEQRLRGLLGERAESVTVATFHRLGLAIVSERRAALGLGEDLRVADEVERLALLREVSGASEARARRLAGELGRRKRERAATEPGAAPGPEAELDDLLDHYDKALRARDLVDFDDLIALPVRLLGADPALAAGYRERWPWVSVDEYQDVDELQYRLLRLLTTPDGNLCAIGDPDQAIYGFRGADVRYFLRFRQDFPGAASTRLSRNYRSSQAIVDGALQAVAPGTLVRDRVLVAQGQRAAPPRLHVHRAASEAAEAEFVVYTIERLLGGSTFFSFDSGRVEGDGADNLSFADIAVLYRTDAQAPALVEALSRAGMPFQKRSHDRLADLPGVQAVLAALRAAPPEGAPAEPTVLARVRRAAAGAGVAGVDLEALEPLAARCGEDLGRFLAELALGAQVDTLDPRADRVSLLTLHASKGLEFPVVFLVGCEDGLLPLRFGAAEPSAAELAEERRLLFVGMTRAQSHLYLTWAARRARRGAVAEAAVSPFLASVDEALLERLSSAGGRARRAADPRGDQLSLLDT